MFLSSSPLSRTTLALVLFLSTATTTTVVNALDFDNASLRRAVAEYLEDPAAAMAQYGGRPMGDWSTWKVTDTSQLFQGATHFNEEE